MKTRLYKTRYYCTKNEDGSLNYWSPLDDIKVKMGLPSGGYSIYKDLTDLFKKMEIPHVFWN